MRKTVKTGRGTGKTYETVKMMLDNPNLFCIVPSLNFIKSFDYIFDYGEYSRVSNEKMDNVLKRIVLPQDIDSIKRSYPDAQFHIEEADKLLSDMLGIYFSTMTTSHWYVETFRRNDYEKEGL